LKVPPGHCFQLARGKLPPRFVNPFFFFLTTKVGVFPAERSGSPFNDTLRGLAPAVPIFTAATFLVSFSGVGPFTFLRISAPGREYILLLCFLLSALPFGLAIPRPPFALGRPGQSMSTGGFQSVFCAAAAAVFGYLHPAPFGVTSAVTSLSSPCPLTSCGTWLMQWLHASSSSAYSWECYSLRRFSRYPPDPLGDSFGALSHSFWTSPLYPRQV